MSRLLRHSPRSNEPEQTLNLTDGGSVRVSALLNHPAMSRTHVTQAEISTITCERDIDRKMRFEVEATLDGPKVLCLQGHTLPVTRVNVVPNRPHQRYLIHATGASSSEEILRSGTKRMENRHEFHFSELNDDARQSKYLVMFDPNSRGWAWARS